MRPYLALQLYAALLVTAGAIYDYRLVAGVALTLQIATFYVDLKTR